MIGELVGKRYEIKKYLGSSEIGSTYLAYDCILEKDIALKLIITERINDKFTYDNFCQVFQSFIKFDHPNIQKAYDSGLVSIPYLEKGRTKEKKRSVPFIVFEYFKGENIISAFKKKIISSDALQGYLIDLLNAVDYMHKEGFVHRSIKPENVLISSENEIKLLNFGIYPQKIKLPEKNWVMDVEETSSIYMCPEIAAGKPGNKSSDMYSLGILMFELFSGKTPFHPDMISEETGYYTKRYISALKNANPNMSDDLINIIVSLIDKEPERRFPSIGEIISELGKMTSHNQESKTTRAEGVSRYYNIALLPVVPNMRRAGEEKKIIEYIMSDSENKPFILVLKSCQGIGKGFIMKRIKDFSRLIGLNFYSGCCLKKVKPIFSPMIQVGRSYLSERKTTLSDFMEFEGILGALLGERGFRTIETEDLNRPFLSEERVFESFQRFFNQISKEKGLIIFLEDLQWADESTMKLLDFLSTRIKNCRIHIIATFQTDVNLKENTVWKYLDRLRNNDLMKEIETSSFILKETENLIKGISGALSINREFLEVIFGKSKGNPLYICEAIRKLNSEEQISIINNEMECRMSYVNGLMESLYELVSMRIMMLPESLKNLYKTASVIGRVFPFAMLWEAMGRIPEDSINDLLERGRKLGYHYETLVSGELVCVFTHNIHCEAFYDLMNQNEKRDLHAIVGRIVEETNFENLISNFEELVMHFCLGMDSDRTINYTIKAADKNALIGSYKKAVGFYEDAIELINMRMDKSKEKWKCYRNLGILYKRMKNIEKAIDSQMKALNLAEKKKDVGTIQECQFLIAETYMAVGDNKKAWEAIADGLSYETLRDNIWVCHLLLRRGKLAMLCRYENRSFDDVVMDVKEAYKIAQYLRNIEATIETSETLADLYADQYMIEEAEKSLQKILKYRTDKKMKLRILEKLGSLFVFPGSDYKKAFRYYFSALEESNKMNNSLSIINCMNSIAKLYCNTGECKKAESYIKKAYVMKEKVDETAMIPVHLTMCMLLFAKGQHNKAKKALLALSKMMEQFPEPGINAQINILLAKIVLIERKTDEAREYFNKALDISEGWKYFPGVTYSQLGLAEVSLSEGNLYAARQHFVGASFHSKKGEDKLANALLQTLHGIVYRFEGNIEMALVHLTNASNILGSIGCFYELGRVYLELARTYLSSSSITAADDARICFNKSKEYFSRLSNKYMVSNINREASLIKKEMTPVGS